MSDNGWVGWDEVLRLAAGEGLSVVVAEPRPRDPNIYYHQINDYYDAPCSRCPERMRISPHIVDRAERSWDIVRIPCRVPGCSGVFPADPKFYFAAQERL